MAKIDIEHTSRKDRQCNAGTLRHTIRSGERYRRTATTPGDTDRGNEHWEHHNECRSCAAWRGEPLAEEEVFDA